MLNWFRRWWWVPVALAGAVVLIFRVHAAKSKAASSVAMVELDKERGVAADEAMAHRKEAEAAKKSANAAVASMQAVSKQLKDADHDKLAALVDAWY